MPHNVSLIALIAAGFGLALVLGLIASRLHVPPLVGYLLAGVAIGPGTPGFVGDLALSGQLAEIGVMLLMFGVGLHFSLNDLLAVRKIAVPGAIVQISAATAMGVGTALWWGWPVGEAVVFGLALSVASTVVLLRALEAKGLLDSTNGRIAVGWLVVEDLAMVLALRHPFNPVLTLLRTAHTSLQLPQAIPGSRKTPKSLRYRSFLETLTPPFAKTSRCLACCRLLRIRQPQRDLWPTTLMNSKLRR